MAGIPTECNLKISYAFLMSPTYPTSLANLILLLKALLCHQMFNCILYLVRISDLKTQNKILILILCSTECELRKTLPLNIKLYNGLVYDVLEMSFRDSVNTLCLFKKYITILIL